ncbi:sugar transferase [Gammaproteobacteria bacterium]|jgi:O-antigen biosynthesis protein WbqP|nr:sugar transferase [Gammaproteobacteria bacterium]
MLHKKLIGILKSIICIAGLVCISPFILLAALALVIEDGLPIFFTQDRLGKHQKVFKIIKIRTLKNSTPHTGTHELDIKHKLLVGSLIRKIKLDEFPQLLNVVKGEINLIGPRPGLPNQHLLLKHREKLKVFSIKPGITGLSQVLGYDMSNPKELSKIDALYINNGKSFRVNSLILLATFVNLPKKYLAKRFNVEDISTIK